jgi:hypothetical protein
MHAQIGVWRRHLLPVTWRNGALEPKEGTAQAASFNLDVGGTDHLAPFLGVVGDELGEGGGRGLKHIAAKVGKLCGYFGIVEHRVDLSVQPIDGVFLGAPMPAQPIAS